MSVIDANVLARESFLLTQPRRRLTSSGSATAVLLGSVAYWPPCTSSTTPRESNDQNVWMSLGGAA